MAAAPLRNVQQFIARMLQLLVCDYGGIGVQIRETVKESIGQELNPTLYVMLFEHLNATVQSFFDKGANKKVATPSHSLFIDQAIHIVRLILDSKLEASSEYLALTDIEPLVMGFVRYLRQAELGEDTLKTKIGLGNLISTIMTRKRSLTFRHEMQFRNSMVEKLMEFVSTNETPSRDALAQAQQADLDIACMKAISACLAGLPLQPLYVDDGSSTMEAKSTMFLKYFTFLMNVTNRCRTTSARSSEPAPIGSRTSSQSLESAPAAGPSADDATGGAQPSTTAASGSAGAPPAGAPPASMRRHGGSRPALLSIARRANNTSMADDSPGPKQVPFQRERFLRQRAQLREYSCQAMSNLLSANIDVGLGHSISMGYHEDESVRLAFTEVLTKVLHQGTEFDTLAETVLIDRYAKLVNLVTDPSLDLVHALSEAVGSDHLDELAVVLQHVFDAQSALLPFLARVAEWEVQACRTAQTLFRRNSLATKLATLCAKHFGQDYLRALLQPVVRQMLATPDASYEIDPSKLKPGESLEANVAQLTRLTALIFDAVFGSVPQVPAPFRVLCFALRRATTAAFPEAAASAVGGFYFLRFVSPALVSPAAHGIEEAQTTLPSRVHRGLLLASKVVQTVANMTQFSGVKEAFMQSMNPFVAERMPQCVSFLNALSALPDNLDMHTVSEFGRFGVSLDERAEPRRSGTLRNICLKPMHTIEAENLAVAEVDLFALHRLLFDNLERVGRVMTVTGIKNRETTTEMSSLLEQLTTLLAQLGDPPKAATTQRRASQSLGSHTKDAKFEEFMTRYRPHHQKIVNEIGAKQIFFQNGVSKNKHPVFYFIARRFHATEFDPDQVIYCVLNELKPHLRASVELVFDLTGFGRDNEPPLPIISRFVNVLPSHLTAGVAQIYIYNMSTWARGFGKRIQRLVVSSKLHKKIQFVSTLEELRAAIPDAHLPAHTVRLREHTHEFGNVTRTLMNKKSQAVAVLVGPMAVQVVSSEKFKLFGLNASTADVIEVASIKEVTNPAPEHLHISYEHGSELLQLTSPDAATIYRIIQETHARHLLSEPANTTARKVMRPSDVPGTLLNMALLNLGSSDPSLRLAAYNFLAALTTTFDFNIGGELMEADGLAIPKNNSNFIIRISECLAEHESRLTLEFLDECIAGLSTSSPEQKHLCLEYMAPWLPNVKNFASGSPEKMLNIIRGLVDVTIKEQELYTSLQANVWYTLGRVEALVVLVMDEFLKVALAAGPGSSPANILSDAAVTLAAANPSLVSQTLITRLLRLLDRTGTETPAHRLEQHPLFRDLEVLSRFLLMLSFNNRLDVPQYLPDTLHIVTMLLACGSPLLRASMLAITINVVQSLGTTMRLSDDSLHLLRLRLAEMLQPKFRHQFSVSNKAPSVFSDVPTLVEALDQSSETVNLQALEAIVDALLEITLACAVPASPWHERWMQLATRAAFARNPALQPRAFVTLGVLTQQLPPDLLPDTLTMFRQALDQWDVMLIDSINMCLTRVLNQLSKGGTYHVALFWTAMAVLQVGEEAVFSSALAVLETTLRTLDQHDAFRGRGIAPVVMAVRATVAELCDQLDYASGISFANNFSFAVAGVLLKGLNHSSAPTIARTIRVLAAFLNVERSARGVELHPDMLGYIAVLFPMVDDVRQSLAQDHSPYGQLLTPDMLASDADVALVLTTLCARLEATKHQTETRFIYEFLAHACERYPHVFPVVHTVLSGKLHGVITRPQDPAVIHSCHSILRTLVPASLAANTAVGIPEGSLDALGFGGLGRSASFENSSKPEQKLLARTCSHLLAKLVSLADAATGDDAFSVCSSPNRSPLASPQKLQPPRDPYESSDSDQAEEEEGGAAQHGGPASPDRRLTVSLRSATDEPEHEDTDA